MNVFFIFLLHGIDTVIGNVSGFPINPKFLKVF